MANEITNQDIMDMLTVLVDRTNRINELEKKIDSRFDQMQTEMENVKTEMKEHFREIDVKLETKVEPTLQLILENQTEVINQKSHITEVETKLDEVKHDVDLLKNFE